MILSALSAGPDELLYAIIAYSIIVLVCFPIHEFGHAWVATRLGDYVAQQEGRVTLNPTAHIDPVGAIFLAIGGFGWARPVPFIATNLRKAPSITVGIILVSIAGITMNLLLAALAALPFRLQLISFSDLLAGTPITRILDYIISINVFLAIFNLIPIPPLDGSHILESLLPPSQRGVMDFFRQYGLFLLILLIIPIGGVSILSRLVDPIETVVVRLLLGF
jgi:Zn-dependent protease